jgi:hypothetical protein
MTVAASLRRLFASQSGQLLIVGVVIALVLAAMWFHLFDRAPWYAGSAVICVFLIGLFVARWLYDRVTGLKRPSLQELVRTRPLEAVLASVLWVLVGAYVALPFWDRLEGSETSTRTITLAVPATSLILSFVHDHYDKRDAKRTAAPTTS